MATMGLAMESTSCLRKIDGFRDNSVVVNVEIERIMF